MCMPYMSTFINTCNSNISVCILEVDLEKVARGTGGFSGADLANLVNQAAIRGSSLGHDGVTNSDLDYARDKILMGMYIAKYRCVFVIEATDMACTNMFYACTCKST